MLGTQYRSAEVEFAKRSQENPDAAAATFSAELLAELLNRTLAVQEAYWLWWERHRIAADATPAGLSERDILGLLDHVLQTFLQDCDEVRARGRRAQLFGGNNVDGTVTRETLDDAKSIERLGGFLVEAHKAGVPSRPTQEEAPTRTVPEHEAQLLERIAKILAVLADAQTALADGECDMAEAWLDNLSAAESVITTYPCVVWPEGGEAQ